MSANWVGLVGMVPRLRGAVAKVPAATMPLLEAGARAAVMAFGRHQIEDDSDSDSIVGMINLGALAVSSRCQPATYLVRPAASRLILETDLHSIPDAPPRLLRAPGIVETRRPETGERLWGDYVSLGWYVLDGAICLLGLEYPDGFVFGRWVPDWSGADLEPQLHHSGGTVGPADEIDEFVREAARYLVTLGLLAEVEDGPLRIELDKRERATRHVYRDDDRVAPPRSTPAADATEGRVAEPVAVTGHIKRQRYGEGRAKMRYIYVAGYQARRWHGPRWTVERADDAG
jgi:hypothetical protein